MDSTTDEAIMKRHGHLFERIVSFENLLEAARRARRGKRYRPDVLEFNDRLEENLLALRSELIEEAYMTGPYKTFVIYEPKRRFISAAPYRDRVVHHALFNVIEPLFDRTFIDSCYANRHGKGTHKALDHFRDRMRRDTYCLRADVEKFFPSIDHAILKERIRRVIKCPDTLCLIDTILDNSNEQEPTGIYFPEDELLTPCERRHGLPIGNLTSQLWANVYFNSIDHAMTEHYGGRRYLRYVDDIALFSIDRGELEEAFDRLGTALQASRLRLHPSKTQIIRARDGVNFLGFRYFPDRIRLRQDNLIRARRRMRGLVREYAAGRSPWADIAQSLQSWNAHTAYGDTWRLRERVFDALAFARR